MRKRKYIINLFAAAALLVSCNESLEDTYSDYAGDGKIRYVSKCTEVYTTPRWEALTLNWVNGTDATTQKIKVIWSSEDRRDTVLLPRSSTSFELNNLVDGTYRFDICALDSMGNESLPETTYGRPYTRQHEVMLAFTRGVLKPYFLKNKLIFFTDQWNENIVEIKLVYKDSEKKEQTYVFDKEKSYNTLVSLPDVSMDPADTVFIYRKGKLEDCPDIIEFDKLAVSQKKTYSAGFVNAINRRYGHSTETKEDEVKFEEFLATVTELEFDYDLETFEDVLYCPKLTKLIFCKNRYLSPLYSTEFDRPKLLGPLEKSVQILEKASEADVLGLTIDYYGASFLTPYLEDLLDFMNHVDRSPQLPQMEIITEDKFKPYEDGNKILCIPADAYAKLENLQDDDYATRWETTSSPTLRRYDMQMQLLEPTEISGIKVAQVHYNPRTDQRTVKFMPTNISIQTSIDGVNWKNVTFFENNELGGGPGEITLLPIPSTEGSRMVRYIKFSLRDRMDTMGNCMIILGDIVLYKLKP